MKIRNATKLGWLEGKSGDGVVLNFLGRARGTVQKGKVPTIQTDGGSTGVIVMDLKKNERIRKLTPRECLRLMAYDDEEIDRLECATDAKGKRVYSNTALYQFAGNSVVVDCLRFIFEQILEDSMNPQEATGEPVQTTLMEFEGGSR